MMKYRYLFLMAFVSSLASDQVFAQLVAPMNHFHVHGWTGAPNDMVAQEQFIRTNIASFGNNVGSRPGYNSFSIPGIGAEANNVIGQLNTTNNFGFGYSAGGLVTRSVSHSQGIVPNPPPANVFVRGFVTMGTPNAGARFATEYPQFVRKFANAETRILRGPLTSFLANFLGSILTAIVEFGLAIARQLEPFFGFKNDMAINSNYITTANGAFMAAREASLPQGRAAVWSDFGQFKYPGFKGGIPGRNDYINRINQAQDNANHHVREADRLRSKRRWWNAVVIGPRIGWHKGRDSDWRDTRDGLIDLNNAWEDHTSRRAASDTFIERNSQMGLPGGGLLRTRQILNAGTGNEITHGQQLSQAGYGTIVQALNDLGIF